VRRSPRCETATSTASPTEYGRIVAAPTAAALRERLVDDWLQAHSTGERAVMIARRRRRRRRRREVDDLNQRARERPRAAGRIGPDALVTDTHAFAVGDRVIARRNDRALGVVNGDGGAVIAVGDGLYVQMHDGRRLELPERYAARVMSTTATR
jgi:ATP-dependent exoDNAse (exonuclease V) alpha subunit